MTPYERLMAEELPTGTFGHTLPAKPPDAHTAPWTPEEQAQHIADLLTARRRCAVCDRPLKAGRFRLCARNCGAALCRATHRPPCADVHGGQCERLELPDDEGTTP